MLKFEKKQIQSFQSYGKYYFRNYGSTKIQRLLNEVLISILEKENKNQEELDEDAFEKTTNISSMYSSIEKTIISQD